MGMTLQLSPTIPVNTPKGSAQAWIVIDYSPEHDLFWVCALDDTGEIWTFANPDVRAQKNISIGRTLNGREMDTKSNKE